MNKRVMMYIDSSNFYFHSKKLLQTNSLKFNWAPMISKIFDRCISSEYELANVNYYAGLPDPRVDNISYHKQKNFLDALRRVGIIDVKAGYVLKNKKTGANVEKGVDVMLATDILMNAVTNDYDIAILVSADGDFKYSIDNVKKLGKKVIVCVPVGANCEALSHAADNVIFIEKNDLKSCVNFN